MGKHGKKKTDNDSSVRINKGVAEWVVILLLFLGAFLIRGLYLIQTHDFSTLSYSLSDPASVDDAARTLVKEGKITDEFFWHAPLYPFLLSFLYFVSGSSVIFAKIVQIALGSLTVVFVYLLTRRAFGRRTALIASVLAAFCFPLIFFEAELFAEGIAGLLCVLLVYLFVKIEEKPDPKSAFLCGLAGAAAIMTRPVFLPFFIAASAWVLIRWINSGAKAGRIVSPLASLLSGAIVLLLPVCIVNASVTGEFSFLPFSGGINSFIGNNPDYDYTITIRPGYAWDQLINIPVSKGITSVYEADDYFNNRAWAYIASDPIGFMKGLAVKTAEFFSSREIPRTEDIYMFRDSSPFLFAGVWKLGNFGFPFGVLLPLAIIGIAGFRKSMPMPVYLMIVSYPIAVILVFVSSRYRVPLLPIVSMLAACGISRLYDLVKSKSWKSVGAYAGIGIAIAVVTSLPGPFIEEKIDFSAEYAVSEGMYYARAKEFDSAVASFEKAFQYKPCHAKAAYELAVLYYENGRLGQAEGELRKLLQWPMSCFFNNTGIAGNDRYIEEHRDEFTGTYAKLIADTHEVIGNVLLAQNRFDEAFANFKEAIDLSPPRYDTVKILGDIMFRQKNYAAALSYYTEAFPYIPESADLYSKLGVTYKETGNADDAVLMLGKASEMEPGNPYNHYMLGKIYYGKGDMKMAIEYFQSVVRMSPNEPYVLYELGMSYMELGDYKSAESAFLQSLKVLPDNPAVTDALEKVSGK